MKNFTALTLLFLLACLPQAALSQESPPPEVLAMMELALTGNIEGVQSMVAGGISVNAVDEQQRTPMMWAAFNGHTSVIKFLLEQGAEVDAKDSSGRTALQYASSGPYPETVGLLLARGAEVNVQDTGEGFTALMTAAAEGQMDVVRVLVARGAKVDVTDKDGDTAESFARQNGHSEVAEWLADQPLTADIPD